MTIPTTAFSEATPAGTEQRALGAQRMRELKTQFREIIAVDHNFASSGSSADNGKHKKLTLPSTTAPAGSADTIKIYAAEIAAKAELFFIDEDDNEQQLTSGGMFIGGLVGEVRIFNGLISAIPTGWRLCDGTNSTPNLVGKFIRGIQTDATNPGTTGGSDTVSSVLKHTHTITVNSSGAHAHTGTTDKGGTTRNESSMKYINVLGSRQVGGQTTHSHTFTTSAGSSHNHSASTAAQAGAVSSYDNRPAYYEGAYIVKV